MNTLLPPQPIYNDSPSRLPFPFFHRLRLFGPLRLPPITYYVTVNEEVCSEGGIRRVASVIMIRSGLAFMRPRPRNELLSEIRSIGDSRRRFPVVSSFPPFPRALMCPSTVGIPGRCLLLCSTRSMTRILRVLCVFYLLLYLFMRFRHVRAKKLLTGDPQT